MIGRCGNAYDLSEHRRKADVIGFFFFCQLCPARCTVLKIFARLFRIEQVKPSRKGLAEAVYEQEETKPRQKRRNRNDQKVLFFLRLRLRR